MYVCMYVCMYMFVCMYMCVCVCLCLQGSSHSSLTSSPSFPPLHCGPFFSPWGHHSWPTALWPELSHTSLLHQGASRATSAFTLGIPVLAPVEASHLQLQLTLTDRMSGRPTFQGRRRKPMPATPGHTAHPGASNASTGTPPCCSLSGDWYLLR